MCCLQYIGSSVLLAGCDILFCRDIEMHGDERVIKDWSAEQKKEYSLVLLSFHVPGKMITVLPVSIWGSGCETESKRNPEF